MRRVWRTLRSQLVRVVIAHGHSSELGCHLVLVRFSRFRTTSRRQGIIAQISQIDPDGVEVVCFPGSGGEGGADYDITRNVKHTEGLEEMVTAHPPGGDCLMAPAMEAVLKEAFERGFDERPCSILVLTAGRPTDHEALSNLLAEAATKVSKDSDLTVTFVQVGDNEWATNYLKELDTELTTTSASGEHIDIVDTIKDEEVQEAVQEMKGGKSGNGLAGGLLGASLVRRLWFPRLRPASLRSSRPSGT